MLYVLFPPRMAIIRNSKTSSSPSARRVTSCVIIRNASKLKNHAATRTSAHKTHASRDDCTDRAKAFAEVLSYTVLGDRRPRVHSRGSPAHQTRVMIHSRVHMINLCPQTEQTMARGEHSHQSDLRGRRRSDSSRREYFRLATLGRRCPFGSLCCQVVVRTGPTEDMCEPCLCAQNG